MNTVLDDEHEKKRPTVHPVLGLGEPRTSPFPDTPCMPYMPTLTPQTTPM